jgi:NAD(P)H-hydrate epimerase
VPKSFLTEAGLAVQAITTDEMREVDRVAIEETGPNLYQMMENAGRTLATLALSELGERWSRAHVVVLAGAGGNGGGGICAARHLANRGLRVSLCLASPDSLGEVPAWQRRVFQGTSGQEVAIRDLEQEQYNLVLDALVGYSLRGSPRGITAELIRWVNEHDAPVLSLDVPSGVDSTTGEVPGDFVRAQATMTLALPKTGLVPRRTGRLLLADIGIPAETYRQLGLAHASPFGDRYLVTLEAAADED